MTCRFVSGTAPTGAFCVRRRAKHLGGACFFEPECLKEVGMIPGYDGPASPDQAGHYRMVGGSTDSIDGGKKMNPLHEAQMIVADQRFPEDGITSLEYEVTGIEHNRLYTRIDVML